MKLISTSTTQVIRFIEPKEGIGPRSPIPLINWLQETYGFVQVPRAIAELNLQAGVNFLQGYYQGQIIEKFSVYNNGLLCESKLHTDVGDSFLDEIFSSVPTKFGIEIKEAGRAYLSQMEVQMPNDIGEIFKKFSSAGKLIVDTIERYGVHVSAEEYRCIGLKMHYDQTGKDRPHSPEFVFERRAATPYSENVYFSSAPLRTSDHMQMLEVFEKILTS